MRKIFTLIVFVLALVFIQSCNNSDSEGGRSLQPNVSGSTGEVVIVIDKDKWEGEMGDEIRDLLANPIDGLPQAEPTFDLVSVPSGNFGEYYITHRNIIFFQTGPDKEKQASFQTNKYASTQLIITIQGKDDKELIEVLLENRKLIVDKINIAERDRWISYYKRSLNSISFNKLRTDHKLILHVPANYALDVSEKGFVWMSYETPTTTQSVLVHYFDYNGENYFNRDSIISIRNNMTKEKIKGPVDGTWMTIEERAPVEYTTFRFRDRNYAMLRGLWTLENGFMGGPFVTLVTKDEVNNRFVMVDGYVYAPNDDKRELLRQVEAILYTISFDIGDSKN